MGADTFFRERLEEFVCSSLAMIGYTFLLDSSDEITIQSIMAVKAERWMRRLQEKGGKEK